MNKIKYIWEYVNEVDNIHQTIHCTEEEFLEKYKHVGLPKNYHKLEWTRRTEEEDEVIEIIMKERDRAADALGKHLEISGAEEFKVAREINGMKFEVKVARI